MHRWPLFLIPVAVALAAVPFIPSPDDRAAGAVAAQARVQPDQDRRTGFIPRNTPQAGRSRTGAGALGIDPALQSVYAASVAGAARVNIGSSGTGSGFFLSPDGLLLTAAHVALAEPGASLIVTTGDDQTRPARVIGYDEVQDVALLRVQGASFTALPLAAGLPGVGDGVVAIGNSRGDFDAGRAGRVTALNASLDASFPSGLVASSMPLAPGDSGGPVLNARGEVVGVSDAVGRSEAGFRSYFVSLTASSALLADLRAGVQRGVPVLGVGVADARAVLGSSGVLITAVTPGLGAQVAGLRAATVRAVQDDAGRVSREVTSADVIVAVDGQPMASPSDLIGYLRGKRAGDRVTLELRRDGRPLSVTVTLSDKAAA